MPDQRISREAIERIIQHAAELQASERDIGDSMSRSELLALGKEVGIPERCLVQALLDEETRPATQPATRGVLDWLAGTESLAVARVVPGDRPTVERALASWLEREELLQIKRRFPDVTTWEPKAGAFASLQRALGAGGKRFTLARAGEIAASVTPLETGFCHVRLVADVTPERRRRLVTAGGLLAAGLVFATTLGPVLGVLTVWAYLPAVVMPFAAVAQGRRHVRENERMQIALEQVLDRLERGELRPAPRLASPAAAALGRIADELKRTLEF